ncbi:hypothetical protein D3C81_1684790 [compost metagenome]
MIVGYLDLRFQQLSHFEFHHNLLAQVIQAHAVLHQSLIQGILRAELGFVAFDFGVDVGVRDRNILLGSLLVHELLVNEVRQGLFPAAGSQFVIKSILRNFHPVDRSHGLRFG